MANENAWRLMLNVRLDFKFVQFCWEKNNSMIKLALIYSTLVQLKNVCDFHFEFSISSFNQKIFTILIYDHITASQMHIKTPKGNLYQFASILLLLSCFYYSIVKLLEGPFCVFSAFLFIRLLCVIFHEHFFFAVRKRAEVSFYWFFIQILKGKVVFRLQGNVFLFLLFMGTLETFAQEGSYSYRNSVFLRFLEIYLSSLRSWIVLN